ncbi:UNVERIFIED_CONTAM: hypothetical protein Sangu_2486500 [Sesamum angustifolium]|uniref:Retrotransposon gag domain-containing protein n=1 Tax=Sesamum angustifolium TaxID=2727405 RepID=A0AAW2IKR0_9LAMI
MNKGIASEGARADPVAGREESGESAESSIALASADCTLKNRLKYVASLFVGNALIWWRFVKRAYEPREITWVEFQREFDDKYIPKVYRDKKMMEFLNLVQGDEQIVAEYELRFAALAKYAPEAVVGELDRVTTGGQLSLRVALLVGGDMWDSVGDQMLYLGFVITSEELKSRGRGMGRDIGNRDGNHSVAAVMDLKEFDVIFGMDWLAQHRAVVDCYKEEVMIESSGQLKVIFVGERQVVPVCMISAIEARRLILEGCEAYLAHVINAEKVNLTLEEIHVVRDFPEVFPDDLPGLPPNRKADFMIETIPGVASISIAPYRMALVDCKSLRNK